MENDFESNESVVSGKSYATFLWVYGRNPLIQKLRGEDFLEARGAGSEVFNSMFFQETGPLLNLRKDVDILEG